MKYQIDLTIKKMMFVSAKNKTEARKKAKEKLENQKARSYLKIESVFENDFGFFIKEDFENE